MRLVLVRHAQTTSNVDGLLDTDDPGAVLTELGRKQALALPQALDSEQIEAIYASTLVRTQQTAAPLAKAVGLQVQVRDGIREVRAGELEMLADEASLRAYLDTSFGWSRGMSDARIPGGESGEEVLARYDQVVAEAACVGAGTAVIVSHGVVIRSWTAARVDNITSTFIEHNRLANTGAVTLVGNPQDGWHGLTWEGGALGGPEVETPVHRGGPAGDPREVTIGDRFASAAVDGDSERERKPGLK